MSARVSIVQSVAVYDGRDYLGDVAKLANGQFAALNPDAIRLGIFDQRADAERLILCRRRERPGGDADG